MPDLNCGADKSTSRPKDSHLAGKGCRQFAIFQLKISILKIVTFNINNINKRLDNLLAWLGKTEPDVVVCLQELRAEQRAFPERARRAQGYHSVWQGQRSWNGVAILSRDHEPIPIRSNLPGNPEDSQAR